MCAVDRMDQNIDNYRMGVHSKKWWWPVFAFAVDASLHNTWQLYRKADNNCPLDYLAFTRRIVQLYLHKYGTPPAMPGHPLATKPYRKGFCQESALTAKTIFCYQLKSNPGVPCVKKIHEKCARNAESTYTSIALKNSTTWDCSNS